ncbi:---NA---, partial [Pelobates cultripes]
NGLKGEILETVNIIPKVNDLKGEILETVIIHFRFGLAVRRPVSASGWRSKLGLPAGRFGTHSFRIGAATEAARTGRLCPHF